MQATDVVAILGLSRTVPEWLETSLPLIEFTSQGKLVRRMRHSFELWCDLVKAFTDRCLSLKTTV
jgi:hypothetical protein